MKDLSSMRKTREQRRNESAEKVCRELRYQIAKYGMVHDWDALYKHLGPWMKNAKKNKYERPN